MGAYHASFDDCCWDIMRQLSGMRIHIRRQAGWRACRSFAAGALRQVGQKDYERAITKAGEKSGRFR